MAETVASALNRLTDSSFAELLSARDRSAMTALLEDYFCVGPEEHYEIERDDNGEDPGMLLSKQQTSSMHK